MVSTQYVSPFRVNNRIGFTSNAARQPKDPVYAQNTHGTLDHVMFTGHVKRKRVAEEGTDTDVDMLSESEDDIEQEPKKVNAGSFRDAVFANSSPKSVEEVFQDIGKSIDNFVREHRIPQNLLADPAFKKLEIEIHQGLNRASHDPNPYLYMSAKDQIIQDFSCSIHRFAGSHNMDEKQTNEAVTRVKDWVWAMGIHSR